MKKTVLFVLVCLLIVVSCSKPSLASNEAYLSEVPDGYFIVHTDKSKSICVVNSDAVVMLVPQKDDTCEIYLNFGRGGTGVDTSSFRTTESYSAVVALVNQAKSDS